MRIAHQGSWGHGVILITTLFLLENSKLVIIWFLSTKVVIMDSSETPKDFGMMYVLVIYLVVWLMMFVMCCMGKKTEDRMSWWEWTMFFGVPCLWFLVALFVLIITVLGKFDTIFGDSEGVRILILLVLCLSYFFYPVCCFFWLQLNTNGNDANNNIDMVLSQ